MEVLRQFIDADKLTKVMTLPQTLLNRKLEVIVMPAEEIKENKKRKEIGSIVDSLVGAIPDEGKSLNDYREERLSKYEAAN